MPPAKTMPTAPARPVAPTRPVAPSRPTAPVAARPRPLPSPTAAPTSPQPMAGPGGLATGKGWRGVTSNSAGILSILASPLPLFTKATFEQPEGYAFLFAGVVLAGLGILFAALQAEKGESLASRRGLRLSVLGALLSIGLLALDQFVVPNLG